MRFPELQAGEVTREMLSVFGGLNTNPRISAGELADMENLTSDCYPLLASRGKRGLYARLGNPQGLAARDGLCYVDGRNIVVDGAVYDLSLSEWPEDCPKRIVSMGSYLLVFPDKKYINTVHPEDRGSMETEWIQEGREVFSPCDAEGTLLEPAYIQAEPPENPEALALWLDGAGALRQWSAGSSMWVDVTQRYVRLTAAGIGNVFRVGDGVKLSGLPASLKALEGTSVIAASGENFLVLPGALSQEVSYTGRISISRKLPEMDFVISCGNRLWCCRYGANADGEPVNEIYASKLGDFRNWNCFQGASTDSYMVSLGNDGAFTGAAEFQGSPVFFRENCIHRVYGSYPAAYRLQTILCPGVQRGSGDSIAAADGGLYYKACRGVRFFDGTLSADVSPELTENYTDAVAGVLGSKYYISMADAGGEYHLFVFDRARKLWHREDGTKVRAFCSCGEKLYFLDDDGKIWATAGDSEDTVRWMAQTGDLGLDSPDNKYLSRLTLRFRLEAGGELRVKVRYDEETAWHTVAILPGRGLGSVTLPFGLRRCDHLYLRLEGHGEMRLYSITKTMEQGSDVF